MRGKKERVFFSALFMELFVWACVKRVGLSLGVFVWIMVKL